MNAHFKQAKYEWDIDEDKLYLLVEVGDRKSKYWEKVQNFWERVRDRRVSSLTESQKSWLNDIEFKLREEDA